MENIIKQIRKIKGVVTVEKAGKNMFVGIFEPKSESPMPVIVKTEDQWNFVKANGGVPVWGRTIYMQAVSFPIYISLKSLIREWTTFSKPKYLSPDELVDGKIYVQQHTDGDSYPFRFKSAKNTRLYYYTSCKKDGDADSYSEDDWLVSGVGSIYVIIRHATPAEAQSLIRAEIANNFFFELK